MILGGKLFAIGVVALVAVRIASVLAGFIIVATLGWAGLFRSRHKLPITQYAWVKAKSLC
jgi:UPF0716 family protein affecting phage T7 exclusion